ncbi:cytidine and deoxycytidylate deaminase related protein [Cyclospora cayetanensis]|uniref:Cytidine and deoxycytidylate deaminase related protein n=1 Tax=Cyclospora cayetanensis TaxID=88456 RepID=A0A1D3D0W3_9EIME|nr:cytidine and deoxycytidylate deaminase related protein [Cyclospora cayetanensis]
MLACYRGALVSVCAGVFVEILQADGRPLALLSDHAFDEESPSRKRRRSSTGGSDDEFEGANVDKLGPEGDCLAGRVGLSAEEVAFLSENRLAPPPLSDLTELIPEADAPDKIIGHFDKVSRPADSSRPLSMERSATWGIIIRDGIIKVGGQEFAFSRLDAELKEL